MAYKILVVEDTVDTRALIKMMLTLEGYSVYEAADGREGLAQAKGVQPDMIVTDIRMPEMSGIEMVEHLRQDTTFAKTPILVLSAFGDEITNAINAGASGALLKPVMPENVIRAVRRMLV
ncbi:MAG TPA: response regulator [Blastocatellia bacterium]|nr:response regulator [Blastocatellia bacterium]